MKQHINTSMADGTSWHGHTFWSSLDQLMQILGEPIHDPTDKGQWWWCLDHDGSVIVIYDAAWQPYRPTDMVRYRIGAHSPEQSYAALQYLTNATIPVPAPLP